ncbi:hypothetical protein DPSP01_001192 [Paraphaeosphaeria sporulosa]
MSRGKQHCRKLYELQEPIPLDPWPSCRQPLSPSSEPPRKKRLIHRAALALVQQPATEQVGGRSSFFKFPREIRNKVYHHLWKDTPHMAVACDATSTYKAILRARAVITAIYDSWPDHKNGKLDNIHALWLDRTHFTNTCFHIGSMKTLPQWLLANKQILIEGLEQFQNRGVWCVSDPAELSRDLAIQQLLHPAIAEDMIVCLENMFNMYYLEGYPTRLTRQWAIPKHDSLTALYRLLLDNGGGEPRLKLLEFRSTTRYLRLDYHPQLYEFFLGLQKACADEEAGDDDEDEEENDDHLWYYYPDNAPDLDVVIHDDYPLTGLDEDLFDLSYLAPPPQLRKSLQQLHVQARFPDDHDVPPSAAQEMMYGGMAKLLCIIFPNHDMSTTSPLQNTSKTTKLPPKSTSTARKILDMTSGRVLDSDGAGGRYNGARWEFRRGPFRLSRERERGGAWALRKRDGCEVEYFPECLERCPFSAPTAPPTSSAGGIHSTLTWPPTMAMLSALMPSRTTPGSRAAVRYFMSLWPPVAASASESRSAVATTPSRSRLRPQRLQLRASAEFR